MKDIPPIVFIAGAVVLGVVALALLIFFRPRTAVVQTPAQPGLPTQTQGVLKGFDSYNLPGSPEGISQPNTTRLPGKPAPTTQPQEPTYCTQDAMLCPDGSYVGRVPPSCQFAACPGS